MWVWVWIGGWVCLAWAGVDEREWVFVWVWSIVGTYVLAQCVDGYAPV